VILAAGLTPAWQQIVVLDALSTGEVNRAREVHWCASGKVLNVGLALHCLSTSSPLRKGGLGGSRRVSTGSGTQFNRDPKDAAGTAAQPAVPAASGGERASSAGDTRSPSANPERASVSPTISESACGSRLNEKDAGARTLAIVGGRPGGAIRREFAELGVSSRWIVSQTPTRVCTTILDRASGQTTELVENAGAISPDELDAFRQAYFEEAARADVVVLTGSLPAGVPTTFYRDLIQKTPGRVVLDTQGEPLLAALECRPFVVKPNREELGRSLSRRLESDADLHDAMRDLCRGGAGWVVVSQGKERIWIGSERERLSFVPLPVEVVNPIGSGDCLAAGIAAALARGEEMHNAVALGMAAASENVGQLLPARLDPIRVAALADTLRPK
jgi:1-phosphofructokinase family hexose kinase